MSITIGFDPGFGNTKAAIANGTIKSIAIPTVVGVGHTDMGMLVDEWERGGLPDEVQFEGYNYLVGEHVENYARPIERMDFQRLADAPELRAMFYTSIYRLLGEGDHGHAGVLVGLPVEVMLNRQLGKEILRDLRNWMQGGHEYTVNNMTVKITINRVSAKAQPVGGLLSWGMDGNGNWIKGQESLKETTAIADIGFNTLDLFAVRGGQVAARYAGGETRGMRRAAEILVEVISKQHGVNLSLHEADAILREKEPAISTSSGTIDLSNLVRQALDTIASSVLMFIERKWGNAKQFRHVLFTGGGAEALRCQLARHYPHGVVLDKAITANAIGLAKYGRRAIK